MAETKDFVVFYSWQNDSPLQTNRTAIGDALEAAAPALKDDLELRGLKLVIDEATRNDPGAPNIPQRIMQKIDCCDVFVCDVTTINVEAKGVTRKTANPNVLIELGYAVARLGWDRIVMLLNKEFGAMDDLPFDIDRQRASGYRLPLGKPVTAQREKLNALVVLAIRTILEKNPPKRMDIASPEEERRRRDVANIRWLLEYVHWPTLEAHLEASPKFISFEVFHFWESFNGIMGSKSFHLYDDDLLSKFKNVRRHWSRSFEFDQHYEGKPGLRGAIFTRNRNSGWTPEERRHWKEIETANTELSRAMDELLSDLRNRYLEIDIDQMNEIAWTKYVAFMNRKTKLSKELAKLIEKRKPSAPRSTPRKDARDK